MLAVIVTHEYTYMNLYCFFVFTDSNRITKISTTNDEKQGGVELYSILFTRYDSILYKQSMFHAEKEPKLKAASLSVSSSDNAAIATPTIIHRDTMSLQTIELNKSSSMSHHIQIANQDDEDAGTNDISSSDQGKTADEIIENKMFDTLHNNKTCHSQDCNKKLCIGTSGSIFILFGISILASFISYIHNEYNYKCLNLNVDLERLEESRANYSITLDPWLRDNPEMIFYESYCKHKVVNIFGDFPCNCRILAFRSNTDHGYWFNQNDLESMLLRFDNLEAFTVNFYAGYTFFESRLADTFHLSQEMLKNHNHLTALVFIELNFEYIHGLEHLKNLEILSIASSFEEIEFPFKSIGTLTNLKVLHTHQVPYANNTYIDNSICNLKQLIFFELDHMEKLSQVPFDCFAKNFDNLFYFSMAYMFLIEDIDASLWNMNSIRSIFLDFTNSLKQANFDFDTFDGYSQKLEKATIQAPSEVCQSYTSTFQNIIIDQKEYSGFGYLYDNITKIIDNNLTLVPYNDSDTNAFDYNYNSTWHDLSFVSESDSSGLLKFIKQFDPCLGPCSTGVSSYLCATKTHGDGACDPECNIALCGFDGGDCNQLCDLYTSVYDSNTTCTLDTWQMDGVCNMACNNSYCNYDFQDCIYTPSANDTCNNLSYDIENVTCYTDWTNDLWCDSHCEKLSCEGSRSGCGSINPCVKDGSCSTVYGATINLLAATYEPYELITLNEVCENFGLLTIIIETNIDNLNCSQAFDFADLNNNGYIGFWEAIVYTAQHWGLYGAVHWQEKLQQIDCSSCLENASLYWW